MSFQEAICRIRIELPASHEPEVSTQCDKLSVVEKEPNIPIETRLKWVGSIYEQFDRQKLDDSCGVRDWDLILSLDGSAKNSADNESKPLPSTRVYPARYRIPNAIIEPLNSNKEKVERAELFALGGFLYYVLSGKEMFSSNKVGEHIQSRLINGEFPEDVWELPNAARILACWCPKFPKDLLGDQSLGSKAVSYIKKHPVLFSLQVAGGIASLASIIALPILGAVGFGAAGPVVGSAAAAWQSSIGLVEAGSFFAWCQSAAMGGAAVGGILATGLTGAGVAVGAALTGALDGVDATTLKEKFLTAWKQDVGET